MKLFGNFLGHWKNGIRKSRTPKNQQPRLRSNFYQQKRECDLHYAWHDLLVCSFHCLSMSVPIYFVCHLWVCNVYSLVQQTSNHLRTKTMSVLNQQNQNEVFLSCLSSLNLIGERCKSTCDWPKVRWAQVESRQLPHFPFWSWILTRGVPHNWWTYPKRKWQFSYYTKKYFTSSDPHHDISKQPR